MKVEYASQGGSGPVYEIEADRHGSYSIRREGVVVKRVTSLTNYPGRPRWGSRQLELAAIEEAKALVDSQQAS